MANYVKSTNFASKDALPLGDPLKVVKGTEIDIEFNNIATAVTSKADSVSPTFTGTPFAPTATFGTNTTQVATTAFVQAALGALYPVGSVYINATNAANPATLLGFGTWTAFGAGRVMVGLDAADPLFDTAEETGGSKDAVVVSHSHTASTTGAHTHTTSIERFLNYRGDAFQSGANMYVQNFSNATDLPSSSAGDHTHTISTEGSSGTNANLQPYITVYMWKRTA